MMSELFSGSLEEMMDNGSDDAGEEVGDIVIDEGDDNVDGALSFSAGFNTDHSEPATPAYPSDSKPTFNKVEFDPTLVQDARMDLGNEGGVYRTGSNPLVQTGKKQESGDFVVSGFSVETHSGSGVKVNVNAIFSDIDLAMASVNRNIFFLPVNDGMLKPCKIVGGYPIISRDERHLYTYVLDGDGGLWRRV